MESLHAIPDRGEPPLSAAGNHAMEPVTLVQLGAVDMLQVEPDRRIGRTAGGTDDGLGSVQDVAEFATVARPVAKDLRNSAK